jgi:peptide/nickel transport system substrate-binding protein
VLRQILHTGERRRVAIVRLVACAAILLALVSATGVKSGASTSRANAGGTLTIANTEPPGNLNPILSTNDGAELMYSDLAYEPLIYVNAQTNTYQPGLAVAWHYTNNGSAFVLNLRPNVHFSDGSLLTAQDVANSILAVGSDHGGLAIYEAVIKSIKVIGPLSLQLNLTGHDPDLPLLLSQSMMGPDVVAPSALADPTTLATSTDGAGPYMLDAAETVAGSTYTYVPNPHFFDPSAVHYSKVVIEVISNLSSELDALRSGQVQFAWGSASTIPQAKSDGLKVYTGLESWDGALLFDRNGVLAKPLSSLKVRQALNYAINRTADAQTIYGTGLATATDEPQVPGYEGYVKSFVNYYSYNVAKAKELLKEAGYPHGFTLTVGATSNEYVGSASQAAALASDWAAIGVHVQIKAYATVPDIVTPWIEAKLPVTAGGYNGLPMYTEAQQVLTKNAGLFNPFKSVDPTLNKLMTVAENAPTLAAGQADWAKVTEEVVKLAWFAPIANSDAIYYASSSLKGVAVSPLAYDADPVGWSGG